MITFVDTEVEFRSRRVEDIGGVKSDGSSIRVKSVEELNRFLNGTEYVCGHNFLKHDLQYLPESFKGSKYKIIDTLYLSPLLFPAKPYHRLVKDDKLQTDELNNPLNDAIKARELFYDEVSAFDRLDDNLKKIYYILLSGKDEFRYFFEYIDFSGLPDRSPAEIIRERFKGQICDIADIKGMTEHFPVELAYCLALVNVTDKDSLTPPWVLKNFPAVEKIMFTLRNNPCLPECEYCKRAFDYKSGLKRYFNFDSFRSYGGKPLQEDAVKAALNNKSILVIFPTGGGKSVTFQLPALMNGENTKGLTVVISPLQSLMKDQVDNLEKKGITKSVTINGLLDPIERAKAIERVRNGSATILYISPESLRSKTIENLLLGRKIARVVIDEAHCFSAWGQDFRVDYLYIGDFLKMLENKKNLHEGIPVSCFTATAKPKVIEDISNYFKEKLSLVLEIISTEVKRTNLSYEVLGKESDDEKYRSMRLLLEAKKSPAIVYVSRTRRAYELAKRLNDDGIVARPYHGQMDKQEKTENQEAFMEGTIDVIVATSAFGMGVDKDNVETVIHYDISDSLENYVQEAGRAGRNQDLSAKCYILYDENDLSKHFILLNQTKLTIKEIQQVWRAIKEITKLRMSISSSALQIARKAGWDDTVTDIETRVKTAIAALETSGYVKRGQNSPRVYANSILVKTANEAIEKINRSSRFSPQEKTNAIRIIRKLFSSKTKIKENSEEAESRIDYISDSLGIVPGDVIRVIMLLREENILADTKDLNAFIKKEEKQNISLSILLLHSSIENMLLSEIEETAGIYNLKELNEKAETAGIKKVTVNKIKTVLNFWEIKNWIKKRNENSPNHIALQLTEQKSLLTKKLEIKHNLAEYILKYLFRRAEEMNNSGETAVEFSVNELKESFRNENFLFSFDPEIGDIEDALFYLTRIEAIKIEGGFLVIHNKLTINRIEENNKIQYKEDDYKNLDQYYKNKIQQIHIVGEYARKMLNDYKGALSFVDDYFSLNYSSFLNKYFQNRKEDLNRNMTPSKFRQLFGELSPRQLSIINDKQNQYIVVAAGPGSGKTRILVHKLASLLMMEDVKHEQLLMLTFSRAAATEFKIRLRGLIKNAANFVDIKTFHSFCFDILGKVGTKEKSDKVIEETIEQIRSGEVEKSKITKTVLVIDEAQDMSKAEFNLIRILMEQNDEMRVIAVGDDDQNIYTFRGADSAYFESFIKLDNSQKYDLLENYRSKRNLVELSNKLASTISRRFKSLPILPYQQDNGMIKIYKYNTKNMVIPLVNDIIETGLSGSSCILTGTNEEAMQVTGLLLNKDLPAKLINSNDNFNLFNLFEFREMYNFLEDKCTTPRITEENWNQLKQYTSRPEFAGNRETCFELLKQFHNFHKKQKYISDFKVMILESKLEDFIPGKTDMIYVSTIHKAKGREFDNVILLLNGFDVTTDERKRVLYVGMTRAKTNLTMHYNSYMPWLSSEKIITDTNDYGPPDEIRLNLKHDEVNLGYFAYVQHRIKKLNTGDKLQITSEGCLNGNNEFILKFSKVMQLKLSELITRNYTLGEGYVKFKIYWKKKEEEEENEILIVLPELRLLRKVN